MQWWYLGLMGALLGLLAQALQIVSQGWMQMQPLPLLGMLLFLGVKLMGDTLLYFWRYEIWVLLAPHPVQQHVAFSLAGLVTGLVGSLAQEYVGGQVNLVLPAVGGYLVLLRQMTAPRAEGS